jgi:glycosyltransferase involved in cell wall biosynthesis
VRFRGTFVAEDRWHVYEEIDVAVMATTVCEPLGRVVQEAAAVGVPTVAPAVGGIREMIRHNINGLLYKFREAQDLEFQLARLLSTESLLPQLIAGLDPVPDTREATARIEKFYDSILSAPRPAQRRDPAGSGPPTHPEQAVP